MSVHDLSLSQRLAAFIVDTSGDAIPAPIVHKAKRHILDTLGASLGGATAQEARSARAVMSGGGQR